MSDTPRTDAVTWKFPEGFPVREHCPAEHARQLERELGLLAAANDSALPLWQRVKSLEKAVIEFSLLRNGRNCSAAARELRIARETLYRKARVLGIDMSR